MAWGSTTLLGAAPLVVCRYANGVLGVPALFARGLFPELVALRGDRGAHSLITRHDHQLSAVPFPDGEVDIDAPADAVRHLN